MAGTGRFTLTDKLKVYAIPSTITPADLEALSLTTDIGGVGVVELVGVENGEGLTDSITGWEPSTSSIPVPDFVSDAVGNIPGDTSYPDSGFELYSHTTDTSRRDALAEGSSHLIVWCFDGDASGEEYEAFPVTIQSNRRSKGRGVNTSRVSCSLGVPTRGALAA